MSLLSKPKKIFDLARKGELIAKLYEKIWLYAIPEIVGSLYLLFYKFVYKNFSVGVRARCWGKIFVSLSPASSVQVGRDAWIVSEPRRSGIAQYARCHLKTMGTGKIIIGNHVGLNATSITARKKIVIGDETMIAPNVIIVDSDFHKIWPPEERFLGMGFENDMEVLIGNHVWIGMNSIILKGVTIGDNSVIAAGSVVSRSIPANVVAGGVPAKVITSLEETVPFDRTGSERGSI